MATVWVPSLLRDLCHGAQQVEVGGSSLLEVIDGLDELCPGIRERLMEQGGLRRDIAFFVDGEDSGHSLRQAVGPSSEVHILPALGGGQPNGRPARE
jgi:sulfur-carrier protein